MSFRVATTTREGFEANLIRVQGLPYVLENGSIRNQFELHLVNKRYVPATFHLAVGAAVAVRVALPVEHVTLEPQAHYRLPVVIFVKDADYSKPFELDVRLDAGELGSRLLHGKFSGPLRLVPRPASAQHRDDEPVSDKHD